MSVDAATVRRIAHLARIAVTDAEVPHLQGELNAMLAFVEQLSEVNVDGVEPMTVLLLEGAILHVEADLRWLDVCERHLGR